MRRRKRRVGPESAPGDLEIVRAFINTADFRAKRDELGSPRELERWLARRGLLADGIELTAEDLRRALGVREALRSLLIANNQGRVDPEAVDRLDEALRDTRFELRFDTDGSARFEPISQGLDATLGRLLEIVVAAQLAGRWPRFKACADSGCRTAFYDRSGRARWCSRQCGDRMRARTYRRGARYRQSRGRGRTIVIDGGVRKF